MQEFKSYEQTQEAMALLKILALGQVKLMKLVFSKLVMLSLNYVIEANTANELSGIREYREVYFKPYRIIYRVCPEGVYAMVIADGRRDMQSLLQRRLLQA